MQFVEHIGADTPARFYIDGKRVSRSAYNHAATRLDLIALRPSGSARIF